MQSVCFPAEAPKFGVGLGVLITQVSIRRLNFLRHYVGEIRSFFCIVLCDGQSFRYEISHFGHRDPSDCSRSQQQHDQEREADCQHLTNRPELERKLHLASATVS